MSKRLHVTLCIWNIPEELKFYSISVDEYEAKILKKVHNKFFGGEALPANIEKAVSSVLAACDPDKSNWQGEGWPAEIAPDKTWLEKTWYDSRIDTSKINVLAKGALIVTGAIM